MSVRQMDRQTMDDKQLSKRPARPAVMPDEPQRLRWEKEGTKGPDDMLMTPTIKEAIVQNLESFSSLGGKRFTD